MLKIAFFKMNFHLALLEKRTPQQQSKNGTNSRATAAGQARQRRGGGLVSSMSTDMGAAAFSHCSPQLPLQLPSFFRLFDFQRHAGSQHS